MVVLGIGIGLFYSSVTNAGVTSLDESRSSLAGGILYMFQIAGGAVGLGLTTTVFLTASNASLDDSVGDLGITLTDQERESVQGVLVGTDAAANLLSEYSGETAAALERLVREAFTAGFRWAFRLDAALALGGLAVAVLFVGGKLSDLRHRPEGADVRP
jgi:hypothetical protein